MTRLKIAEIVAKNDAELAAMLVEKHERLAQLVIDMNTKKLSNVKEIAQIKRTIAQSLTIAREREITRLEQSNG